MPTATLRLMTKIGPSRRIMLLALAVSLSTTVVAAAQETPAFLKSADLQPHTFPLLLKTSASPLAHLRMEVGGDSGSVTLTSLTVDLGGAHASVNELHLYRFDDDRLPAATRHPNAFHDATLLAMAPPSGNATELRAAASLPPGTHDLWIAGKLRNSLSLDDTLTTAVTRVVVNVGGESLSMKPEGPAPIPQRTGVALRKQGDDDAHTYRIPGLVTTRRGTLIAVYDIRHRNGSDLPGDVDVGMSRSTDGGKTWEPSRIIQDMSPEGVGGTDDPKWRWDGIGDPAILVDSVRGTIWVAATWSHGDRAWRGSGPGLTPTETGQLMLSRSDDDGVTWSSPINITEQVKKPEWSYILQGPGKGITMADGTLVFAAQFQDTPDNERLPRSTIMYSRDHGDTWSIGTGAFDDTTEAQVVEIEPGVLMLNARYNRQNERVVMLTRDLGKTWQSHPTSLEAFIEPRSCMASLIDPATELAALNSGTGVLPAPPGELLLFSNPNSTEQRERITIKASLDRGATWPEEHQLLLDEGLGAGYSCMTMIDSETVGILYEGSLAQLTFQRIKLSEPLPQAP